MVKLKIGELTKRRRLQLRSPRDPATAVRQRRFADPPRPPADRPLGAQSLTESIAWISFAKDYGALAAAVTRTENFIHVQFDDADPSAWTGPKAVPRASQHWVEPQPELDRNT
jgi:hypothetical protein